ncbi:MAG: hypothetical protein AAF614_14890 [Chloroflexota bacterium]
MDPRFRGDDAVKLKFIHPNRTYDMGGTTWQNVVKAAGFDSTSSRPPTPVGTTKRRHDKITVRQV